MSFEQLLGDENGLILKEEFFDLATTENNEGITFLSSVMGFEREIIDLELGKYERCIMAIYDGEPYLFWEEVEYEEHNYFVTKMTIKEAYSRAVYYKLEQMKNDWWGDDNDKLKKLGEHLKDLNKAVSLMKEGLQSTPRQTSA